MLFALLLLGVYMNTVIRKAENSDIDRLLELLGQVLEVHAKIRPDIFVSGSTKYTKAQLGEILSDPDTPVFVAADVDGTVSGYAFCRVLLPQSAAVRQEKTLFIDDLCVDEKCRGEKIGSALFDYVREYAKKEGCPFVTLNVWEGNDAARAFYEKHGMRVRETQMEIKVGCETEGETEK